eukprot:PhF_6_TR499/c0_g1_i1/m.254/K20359/RABAC1, PRAF1; PRA1 family protein 1
MTTTTPLEFVSIATPPREDGKPANETGTAETTSTMSLGVLTQKVKDAYEKVKVFKDERLKGMRPWSEFFDRKKFSVPTKLEGVSRANKNIRHFYSNYLVVAFFVSLYVAITNLNFILSMVLCAALFWYYRTATANGEPLVIRGTEVTAPKAYFSLSALTLLLFWFTGGSSTIFWLVFGCGGVVFVHAAAREPPSQFDAELPIPSELV